MYMAVTFLVLCLVHRHTYIVTLYFGNYIYRHTYIVRLYFGNYTYRHTYIVTLYFGNYTYKQYEYIHTLKCRQFTLVYLYKLWVIIYKLHINKLGHPLGHPGMSYEAVSIAHIIISSVRFCQWPHPTSLL